MDSAGPAARLDRTILLLALVVVLGSVMTILDSTIVSVAVDRIARDLHAPLSDVQWVSTGYLLSLSMVIPVTGWSIDRFGAKRVFLVSVGMFVVTSAACASAWSIDSLIVIRFLQGVAGGVTAPVGHVLLARAAGPGRIGRVLGVLGIATTLTPIAGPVVGGVLLQYAGWRWIFLINVPIGIAAILLGLRVLSRAEPVRAQPLDVGGLALLAPAVGLLVYGLSAAGAGSGVTGVRTVSGVAAGLALLGCFVRHARRLGDAALIDVRLFGDRVFACATVATFVVGMSLYAFTLLTPLYFQLVRGDGPFAAGMMMVPQSLGGAVVVFAGRLADRHGCGRVVLTGTTLILAATYVYSGVGVQTSYVVLALALVVRGVGIGSAVVPTMAGAYTHLSPELLPGASSTILLVQRVGGSVGTALAAVVLQSEMTRHLPLHVAGTSGAPSLGQLAHLPRHVLAGLAPSMAHAFDTAFLATMAITAIALVADLGLPRRPRVPAPVAVSAPAPVTEP